MVCVLVVAFVVAFNGLLVYVVGCWFVGLRFELFLVRVVCVWFGFGLLMLLWVLCYVFIGCCIWWYLKVFSWCYLVVRLDCLCCVLVWCCLLWLGCIVWFFVVFVVFWLTGLVVLGDGAVVWMVSCLVSCLCLCLLYSGGF